MNYSDAERIATVFNEHGFSLASSEGESDIIVAVACSVREKAVHKIYGKVEKWRKINKTRNQENKKTKIMVTGCVLPHDKKKLEEKVELVFEIKEIEKLRNFLQKISNFQFSISNKFSMTNDQYLSINPQYHSKYSVFVPIMTGCDNFCSYCAVPYTRGREVSRPQEEILEEIRSLVEAGYKEITLLGQNVNSYGKILNSQFSILNQISNHNDQNLKIETLKNSMEIENCKLKINNPFLTLLKQIDQLEGNYWVRFYANHPKDMSDELINFLVQSKHFCHYIHLPLQSGDDEILKKMNRHYTAKQYLDLVKKIRKKIPDVVLTTDIIVGFPGEDEKAFNNTVDVMKKSKFDMAFIAEYSTRSGTVASKLNDDVTHAEKERRKKYLNDEILAKSILENNKKMVDKKVRILLSGIDNKGFLKGKTAGLKDVKIPFVKTEHTTEIGDFIDVVITKAGSWGLEGKFQE